MVDMPLIACMDFEFMLDHVGYICAKLVYKNLLNIKWHDNSIDKRDIYFRLFSYKPSAHSMWLVCSYGLTFSMSWCSEWLMCSHWDDVLNVFPMCSFRRPDQQSMRLCRFYICRMNVDEYGKHAIDCTTLRPPPNNVVCIWWWWCSVNGMFTIFIFQKLHSYLKVMQIVSFILHELGCIKKALVKFIWPLLYEVEYCTRHPRCSFHMNFTLKSNFKKKGGKFKFSLKK